VTAAPAVERVGPQSGPQEQFLSTSADIAIYGGSVFGGKTWALCYEPLRHVRNPRFSFVIFRRTAPEIRNPGGLWDQTLELYPPLGASSREQPLDWTFPSGAYGKLAGLQHDKDVLGWKGAQIALIEFDQLEEFSEYQFWYLLSRNRSQSGVRPYIRASCNPDPDSWLAGFLAWWIDGDTGYAIPERSGVLRWFVRVKDDIRWADSKAALVEEFGHEVGRFAKSVTFVPASLGDNRIGVAKDPDYEATMRAMPLVEQERLLGGNWKIRHSAGLVFNRAWFEIVDAAPSDARRVRCWDKAGTAGAGDWTAGVKMSEVLDERGRPTFYVEDSTRGQWAANDREVVIKQTAEADGYDCAVQVEQEPGSGGKESAEATVANLAGWDARAKPSSGSKIERANPFAAQCQAGNVKIVRGPWNEAYLRELHAFPTKGIPDDQVDGSSGAFERLTHYEPLIA
jgi:predicted phage terminase large subunit-like protein